MAQLTLNIPDELAERLKPLHNQLPELLGQLLEIHGYSESTPSTASHSNPESSAVYQEILEFLLERPTPIEISDFKVSPTVQNRLQALLDNNREDRLTPSETAELDTYEQLEHLMLLLKVKAYSVMHS